MHRIYCDVCVCGVRESERTKSSVKERRGEWKGNTEEEETEK